MQIHGKDWTLEVSEQDLVRMAMSTLRQNNEKITVQAVADASGLPVSQVVATMRQMVGEYPKGTLASLSDPYYGNDRQPYGTSDE